MSNFETKLDRIMKRIWQQSADIRLPNPPDTEESWMRLEQLMDIEDTKQSISSPIFTTMKPTMFKPKMGWVLAASIVLLIISPILYNFYTTTSITAHRAEIKYVSLSDGSKIQVNADSKISYKHGFGIDHRNITLEGEAYFDVEKNNVPFIVNLDKITVEVLGTEFNIRSRENQKEVSVIKGTVKVSGKDGLSGTILTAGQRVNFNNGFEINGPEIFQYEEYPGWIHNRLILEHTNLQIVCNEIERKFDVNIEFASAYIGNITVSGVIEATALKPVLETVAALAQRSYRFEKDTYIIF